MLSTEERKQYARHLLLEEIGEEKQKQLKKSKVLVVGAGGLGCPVLQYLAAAGVGTIGIIDPDVVSISNLQRQILFTHNDIGKPKVEAAQKHLALLNPFIKIEGYNEALNKENALSLFEKYDLIIEGSDSFTTKYLTNDACILTQKPFILGSIFKFEGQLSVYNYQGGATYRCLFPEPMSSAEMPTCSEVGVLGVLPGVVGTLMANEAIKVLTEMGEILAGRLLKIDLLTLEQTIFEFEKDPTIQIKELELMSISCASKSDLQEIDFETYKQEKKHYNLLDVRTLDERLEFHLGGIHIPLNELPHRWKEIPTEKPIIVYCAMGVRGAKAIAFLKEKILECQFLNLKNGCKDLNI
ncbi:HesA/MoeB/ThiF family protein [Riemerella anatipestifer]|uniref:Molybdopterin-synthase adenylyltransferase n=2 Tax=Riemerella anatipestifer TaxID=34085 RepID=J9R2Y2_RIEAN|nr:HesA/MoeB/ThiF family protein [Riemerella anatipestifer]AFR36174.1 Dinucleotide-utilizing enzymes involved in molybdopterin and thiamine biosynthesis family 2 [Riemerella anatipestifer RA-CH-1]AIH03175.1 UBA/THIF-type NAD/FAD binding protein [Riemerella anatipestifer CH3]AQY22634.1 putative adenylyltransferase/sulfurtransferase MoeZ [Riemerella anatipestifer]MCO7332050.1 HesA/MoeB/ThiF family protein [Riemerella anatipestifer]MCO7350937.1 HesA/MoeB/ThiF family protein [Riemerella anatipesti